MEAPPRDHSDRRESLQRWTEEQARLKQQRRIRRLLLRDRLQIRLTRAAMQRFLVRCEERLANRLFERGLDTSGTTEPEHDHPDRVPNVPSAWHVVPRALRYIGVTERDVFVDYGCGKGRVVHQAARRPFGRVIGVEISPVLAEIARAGVAARRSRYRCGDVEIVVADAKEFEVPDDLTIAYFYHPFTDETFDEVIRRIIDSIDRRPRRVSLIYYVPLNSSRILATGRFRLLTEQRNRLLESTRYRTAIFESC